jgi:PAS domain S-box-containing protein
MNNSGVPPDNISDELHSLVDANLPSVLIIDDQPENLAIISEYLTDSGLTILISQTGESGLQRAEYAKPDLILLDILMPGIDGFETCRRLKSNDSTKEIPVIFMSALSDLVDRVKGFEVGGVDYVTKPVQQEELLNRVRLHLKIREQNKLLQIQTENLKLVNKNLEKEIGIRIKAQNDLQHANELLEKRVEEYLESFQLEVSIEAQKKEASILIIDDQPENLAVIGNYLADSGFTVLVSQSGESGLKRAEYVKPDLILLDILMPGMDGFETCRRLKANDSTKEIPVIFLSALTDVVEKVKGFQVGGVDFISKPVQQEEVLSRVKTHLKIRQQRLQLQQQSAFLFRINKQLENEIQERFKVERELQQTQEFLEKRVEERTFELAQKNTDLKAEIGERKHIEKALRKSENRFRTIFEKAPLGIAVIESCKGKFLQVNPKICEIVQYTAEEMEKKQFLSITHPDDIAEDLKKLELLFTGQINSFKREKRYIRKDGSIVWVSITAVALSKQRETLERHIIMVEDITARKKMVEDLRVSEERLRLALKAANQGLYDIDLVSNKVTLSAEFETMFGFNPGEINTSIDSILMMLHPEDSEHVKSILNDCIHGKTTSFKTEYRMRTKNDEWKWVLSTGKVVGFDKFKKPVRIIGTHTDISEIKHYQQEIETYAHKTAEINSDLKKANEELDKANVRLKELDVLKSEFVSLASHELRTPLTSIIGFAQTLLDKTISLREEDNEKYLQIIINEGMRLSRLLNELLDLSKIETGKTELIFQIFDISVLAQEVVNEMKISERLQVDVITQSDKPIMVRADREKIKQVLYNLISNAVRYTAKGGKITIRLSCQFPNVLVSIQDTGTGIPEEDLSRVFEKFYRVKSERKKSEGSGLGLSITKEIVQAHKGKIWIESKVGSGTTVFFTLSVNNFKKPL